MPIIVGRFSIDTGVKLYAPGETIHELSEQEEAALVADGYARYPDVVVESSPGDTPPADNPSTDKNPPGDIPPPPAGDDGGPKTDVSPSKPGKG